MTPICRCLLPALLPLLGPVALAQDAMPGEPQAPSTAKAVVIPAREHPTDNAEAVALSPDGRLVAASFGGPSNGRFPLRPNGGGIALWEAKTGELVRVIGEYGDILRVEFSPDSRSLAYARIYTPGDGLDDDVVRVIDVATGEVRRSWRGAQTVAMIPKAGEIAVGREIIDLEQLDSRRSLDVRKVQAISGWADGSTLAAVHQTARPFPGGGAILRMNGLSVFDVRKLTGRSTETDLVAHCFQIAVSPDGKLLATGHPDGIVRLWDPATLAEVRTLDVEARGHVLPIFTPDGRSLLLCTQAANGQRWSYDRDQPGGFRVEANRAGADCQVIQLETTGFAETGRWRFEDGGFRTHYARFGPVRNHPEANPRRFALSPDGKFLLAGCNGVVLVELETGKIVRQFALAPEGPKGDGP